MTASDDLRRAAAVLDEQARAVAHALDAVRQDTGPDTWIGPAAERFRAGLASRGSVVAATELDLRSTARALTARAAAADAALPREASGGQEAGS